MNKVTVALSVLVSVLALLLGAFAFQNELGRKAKTRGGQTAGLDD